VGSARYDGQYFTTFAEADSLAANVWAIAQDGNGDMWFGTDRGASRYDGRYFTHFAAADGLLGRQVFAILPGREGNLWFGTDAGVLRYDGKRFERLEPEGEWGAHVRSLFEDRDGALWIGTHSGLFRYGDGKLLHFTSADGLAGNLMGGIAQDPEGALWFSSWERGVSRYQGGEISSFATEEGESPTPANVTCALVDAEGQLWLGSDNGGALRYDGEKFVRFKQQDGLGGDHVSAIAQDPEGHLWFGSEGGLSRYDGGRFRTFTTADGLASDGAERLLEDRAGRLWISTNKGVSRYDGSTFTTLDTSDGLADNRTGAMLEDRSGNLWFATREGVSRYDGERSLYGRGQVAPGGDEPVEQCDKFTERGEVLLSVRSLTDGIELAVADTGRGIPPEDLPFIFEEFRQVEGQEQVAQEGSGLGLAIAKKSVELLGGTIQVESQVGTGTKFSLRIADYEGTQ